MSDHTLAALSILVLSGGFSAVHIGYCAFVSRRRLGCAGDEAGGSRCSARANLGGLFYMGLATAVSWCLLIIWGYPREVRFFDFVRGAFVAMVLSGIAICWIRRTLALRSRIRS